jgi:peptidylprolyl isomerase
VMLFPFWFILRNMAIYMKNIFLCLLALQGLWFNIYAQTLSKETVVIETKFGIMKLKFYEETPLHKANFIKLVKRNFFDSLMFHRVINNFMIQGGDPDSKNANDTAMLGMSDAGYWIPAEFNKKLYHKKGRLCAAREGDDVNPKKESSGCQFYIVMGKIYDSVGLKKAEIRVNCEVVSKINYTTAFGGKSEALKKQYFRLLYQNKEDSLKYYVRQLTDPYSIKEYYKTDRYIFSNEQKKIYNTIGGTPHLDNNYTVFGEVIEGLEIIDKIAGVKTNKKDRPLENIRMTVKLVK